MYIEEGGGGRKRRERKITTDRVEKKRVGERKYIKKVSG